MPIDLIGADSWAPPNQTILDALKEIQGFEFFGGYVGGADLYLQTPWPKEAWQLLESNGIKPLPIWVPRQNCSENPTWQAQEALAACQANGLEGVVAVDSEASMRNALNYQWWLDEFATEIHRNGWLPVTYAGAGYVATGSFAWAVKWGEHEEVPVSGEAIQYGPYTLRDKNGNALASLDGDSADANFPFATFAGESKSSPTPTVNPPTVALAPSIPGKGENEMHIFRAPNGAAYLVCGDKKIGIPDGPDLQAMQESGIGVANVSDQMFNAIISTLQ